MMKVKITGPYDGNLESEEPVSSAVFRGTLPGVTLRVPRPTEVELGSYGNFTEKAPTFSIDGEDVDGNIATEV